MTPPSTTGRVPLRSASGPITNPPNARPIIPEKLISVMSPRCQPNASCIGTIKAERPFTVAPIETARMSADAATITQR